MATPLLEGVRVVDLAGEPAALTGRLLADLGADVVVVEPPEGHALRAQTHEWAAWSAGKRSVVVDGPDDPRLDALLAGADVVLDTPGFPGTWTLDPARAPGAAWVSVTPFGLEGPRAAWRAADLGVLAASSNMWMTGDPDRAPIRCTLPSGYAHSGGEAALAAMSVLWGAPGESRRVDLSMQECVFTANMVSIAQFPLTGERGQRTGANIQRTREIWATKDGFVSCGIRGGAARLGYYAFLAEQMKSEGIPDAEIFDEIDWTTFNNMNATQEELDRIQAAFAEWFSRHTSQEIYELACEHNLFLAPAVTPREMFANAQLLDRDFFGPVGDYAHFPHRFAIVESADGEAAPAEATRPAPALGSSDATWPDRPEALVPARPADAPTPTGIWSGLKILEFGSGAAGPISTRYFVEHGATVIRVESLARPDFVRVLALGPKNPHGLEGAPMFDALNVSKRSATFNLKDPRAVELVKRLIHEWADCVVENFAPRGMRGFGLDYASMAAEKPDLVMVSACLNGQTGPHKDYPGFGSQGSALCGYTYLTGWPDRVPVGPSGTITDSLAPRYVASAVAAGLLYHRRTGRGVYVDLSQVECGIYTLSPWLLRYDAEGVITEAAGNRSDRAVPHGAFPCLDETDAAGATVADRWVAIACWTDDEWARLAAEIGLDDPSLATFAARRDRIDEVEAAVAAWTAGRTRLDVAERLQGLGIEAVPVQDLGDVHDDPQVEVRGHFEHHTNPFMGPRLYEHGGFRVEGFEVAYDRSGPTMGQDNEWVQAELLGLDEETRTAYAAEDVFK